MTLPFNDWHPRSLADKHRRRSMVVSYSMERSPGRIAVKPFASLQLRSYRPCGCDSAVRSTIDVPTLELKIAEVHESIF